MTEAARKKRNRDRIEKAVAYTAGASLGSLPAYFIPHLKAGKVKDQITEMAKRHIDRGHYHISEGAPAWDRPKAYRPSKLRLLQKPLKRHRIQKGATKLWNRVDANTARAISRAAPAGALAGMALGAGGLHLYRKHKKGKRKHSAAFSGFSDELFKVANLGAIQQGIVSPNTGRAMTKLYGATAPATRNAPVSAKNITLATLQAARKAGTAITGGSIHTASVNWALFDELSKIATGMGLPNPAQRQTMPGMKTPGLPRLGNAIQPSGAAGMAPKPPVPPTGMTGVRQ